MVRDMADDPGLGSYIARGVRARRAWLQLSQAEVGERAGWSAQTISELELGRRKVTADDLPALCIALECDLAELVRGAPSALVRPLGLGSSES